MSASVDVYTLNISRSQPTRMWLVTNICDGQPRLIDVQVPARLDNVSRIQALAGSERFSGY